MEDKVRQMLFLCQGLLEPKYQLVPRKIKELLSLVIEKT